MSRINNLLYSFFSRRSLPYWCVLIGDCFLYFFSAMLALLLNEGTFAVYYSLWRILGGLAVYLIFYLMGFRLFHTYSGVVRYSSFVDLQRVASAVALGMTLSIICRLIVGETGILGEITIRSIFTTSLIMVFLMWTARILVKQFYDAACRSFGAVPVFIYGVKEGGISLAKSIRSQDPANYLLAGFATQDSNMKGRVLMGVKVHSADANLVDLMLQKGIKAIFVSPMQSEDFRRNTSFVDALIEHSIKIYMTPREQLWDGKSDLNHMLLKEIDVGDLLPRDKIEIDMEEIGNQLKDKAVMVTGAAGSIGSEIVRQLAKLELKRIILIDQAETPLHDMRLEMKRIYPNMDAPTIVADITDSVRMRQLFERYRPDIVYHAAAYKHVPMMEDNPSESIHNNVNGTRVVANLAVEYDVQKFVMVSTDKAVNPTNIMGCSKRICEIYVQSLDKAIKDGKVNGVTKFVTTRFGNVLGSNGSVIPLFKEQIKNGGPITVTHPDIIRFFMLIPEACRLVMEAGVKGDGGEIFVFDMGEPVKIVDLARRMVKLSGVDIPIVFTGLRDGEKLYEEVLNDKEVTFPTFHPKIKVAKVREYNFAKVSQDIEMLVDLTQEEDDDMKIVAKMKEIVPEYISQNSVYTSLDKK